MSAPATTAAPPATPPTVDPKMRRRALVSSTLGTCIEWYDFYVYGVAAAIILNVQFFPNASPFVGILLSFSTYAIGFAARPIGGIIFAHYGDRLGRKKMLMITLGLMGIGTFLIGVLPTYNTIGIAAPILLVLLRIVQGIGVGGEWGGAALMATEFAPAKRRGFFGSWPQIGVPVGTLLANGAFFIMGGLITPEAFIAWGWRIPFLISIVLVAISFYIRSKVAESPVFEEIKRKGEIEKLPVVKVIKTRPLIILKVVMMRFAENANYYIYTTFLLAYGPAILLEKNSILLATMIMAGLGVFSIPFWGWVSDRWGRRYTVMAGAVTMLVMAFPFFWAVQTGDFFMVLLVLILTCNIGRDLCYSVEPAYFTELFEPKLRYSGASVGPQVAAVFAGGFAPLIATLLIGPEFDRYWLVAVYMVLTSLITLAGAFWSPETAPRVRLRRGLSAEYDPIANK
ncbi:MULTISPECIES: MFS transporter [unclassified Cryobacterium]|uniref:MFS transporter n=1 Tax=unclassified Cryobacterium TaxID=2649013 RepID=UPI00106C5103|nr:MULTISPECIES: MFS transporter [unclassified Cryobacterium]MBC7592674.1 MHS family MFS transporter [Aeromicrobium sp.]TFD02818.1 MFS transporter [Cryobacterium sp. TMT1-66-1]TFD12401.1 MFS transporter [Cryobacterium sp. TMT1-2-2]